MRNFRSTLRQLRKEAHLTQNELADKIFVSRSVVTGLELGYNKPDERIISLLNEVFKFDFNSILTKSDKRIIDSKRKNTTKTSFKSRVLFSLPIIITFLILLTLYNFVPVYMVNHIKTDTISDYWSFFTLLLYFEYFDVAILLQVPIILLSFIPIPIFFIKKYKILNKYKMFSYVLSALLTIIIITLILINGYILINGGKPWSKN